MRTLIANKLSLSVLHNYLTKYGTRKEKDEEEDDEEEEQQEKLL